jgi:hypothetical protein
MLGEQRQTCSRQPVGNARVDSFQSLDRGEQAERAAAGRLDQSRVSASKRREIALPDVGDDHHLGAAGVIERAFRFESLCGMFQVNRSGALFGRFPAVPTAQRGGSDEHALRPLQHRCSERPSRVQPVAVDRNVIFAALDPIDRKPINEIGIGRTTDPV